MKVAHDSLWFCDDCMIVAVNDDPSGIDSEDRVAEVYNGLAILAQRLDAYIVPAFSEEDPDSELTFSAKQCDACLTRPAGARYKMVAISR